MVQEVSTSHPYGDRLEEKNCTKPYRKNPTHYSSNALRYYISEYYGEIFLHFLSGMSLIQMNLSPQRKHFFEMMGAFYCKILANY
jgi:hypothetical protein